MKGLQAFSARGGRGGKCGAGRIDGAAVKVDRRIGAMEFDADWYVRHYGDVPSLIERGCFRDPLHHYMDAGCREGRNPNAEFREDYYRGVYPDIAATIDGKSFTCGFHHYLRHGRAEGRRIRPATRGALVDLTRFDAADAAHARILVMLLSVFERLADWDFRLLTRESGHESLSRIVRANVTRLCIDRIAGDVGEHCKSFPLTVFLAPLGPSSLYLPGLRTITILPDAAAAPSAELEAALAVSDAVLCLTPANRKTVIDLGWVERERVKLLQLPSTGPTGEAPQPTDEPDAGSLPALLERLAEAPRPTGPSREALLGLRDGNRIHASCWFSFPPSAAARSLLLEIAVPADYPEPAVTLVASIAGQPDIPDTVERGRSARIGVALPSQGGRMRLTVGPRRPDGSIVKVQPHWPGVELRAAMLLGSGLDLLRRAALDVGPEPAGSAGDDPDIMVGAINAAVDAAAPALTALEATVGRALAARPALRLTLPAMPSVLRAVAPLALHLVRQQFVDPALRFHGSNKDQAARQQYLRDRGFRVVTEPVRDWKYGDLIKRLDADRHEAPQVIILESMLHHPLMRHLRERFPKARLLVRSHNAEVLHRLHTHTASLLMETGSRWAWLNPREAVGRGKNVFDHWRYDAGAIRLADHVLSISEWETKRYWPHLGPRGKVSTVPYFLPRDLVYAGEIPARKPHRCVCLTSANPGPVIYDALRNFVRLVDGLDDSGDWDFPVTGGLDDRHAARSSRCRYLGRVENPIELMGRATSMALLSHYGYGFKTKILDAISARAYTLMPQALLDRHPPEIRPFCLAVDPSSPASFKSALDRSLEPFPAGDPNEALRRRAYAAMDSILGLG